MQWFVTEPCVCLIAETILCRCILLLFVAGSLVLTTPRAGDDVASWGQPIAVDEQLLRMDELTRRFELRGEC